MTKNKSYFDLIKDGADDAIDTFKDAVKTGKKLKFDTVDIDKVRVKRLEKIIKALDTAFHIKGDDCVDPFSGEIVLDNEYDALKVELKTLSPKSKIFTTVTASSTVSTGDKVIHDPPMTSINKCNGTEDEKEKILSKFFDDCRKVDTDLSGQKYYPGWLAKFFCMSFKMDGIALSLEYENSILKKAGLRSKSGKDGISVIDKILYIQGIPQKLPIPISCIIRGEVYVNIDTFNKINDSLSEKDKKSNARAFCAGSMNRKTAIKIKDKGLRFTAYNILKIEDPPYTTEIERQLWAEKILKLDFVKTIPFSFDKLELFESQHRRLNHMIDGVVVSVNDLELQKKMGHSGNKETGNPKGKCAWKFKDQIKEVTVTSIEWQVGRNVITPVLNFEGVSLEDTIVKKCSAHNLGIIENGKIGVGTRIGICKSGKIIPKIKYVKEAKGKVEYPLFCPACEQPTKRIEGNNDTVSLICDNPTCSARKVQNLNHYLKRIGSKGVAESTISKLCEAGLVSCPSDFYKLTLDKIKAIGIRERSATLILSRIKMIIAPEQEKDNSVLLLLLDKIKDKKIPIKMETFISALGIDQAGQELGRILAEKYNNFESVRKLSEASLEDIDGIGPITASAVYNYFKDNSDEVDELLKFIDIETVEKVTGGKLEGKSFCLSGALDPSKGYWKEQIEAQGGICKSSVSKKLDYLIAADGSGNKSIKAESYGIPILTEEDLEKMLSS